MDGSPGPKQALRSLNLRRFDLPLLILLSGLFYWFLTHHAFDTQLSEWDMYLAALGLWDGYYSGEGVGSTIHYGKWHSFGYILLIYTLASPEVFGPGDQLFQFMNLLGFWASVLCLPLLWIALATGYGRRVAWPATAMFIGSPVFLELAGGTHPLLLALATLLLGTILLWHPARGGVGLVLKLLAAVILCGALSLRLEVVLAFPFLVLAPPAGQNWKPYVRECLPRLFVTLAACALLLIARTHVLDAGEEKSAEFIQAWYSWANVPIGMVALAFATGIASMIVLPWFGLAYARNAVRSNAPWATLMSRMLPWLGPLSLMGITFVFWIANPLPARHFLLFVLGAAIVIVMAAWAKFGSLRKVMVFSALLIAGNQILSAAANPYAVQASGFAAHRGWPYLLTAPSGFAWERREMLKRKWAGAMRAGQIVASGKCGERVIVSAQLSSAVVAQMVSQRPHLPVTNHIRRHGGHVMAMTELEQPVHALIYTRASLQDPPIPKELLHDANLSEFQVAIVSDQPDQPISATIPRERLASQFCSRIKA